MKWETEKRNKDKKKQERLKGREVSKNTLRHQFYEEMAKKHIPGQKQEKKGRESNEPAEDNRRYAETANFCAGYAGLPDPIDICARNKRTLLSCVKYDIVNNLIEKVNYRNGCSEDIKNLDEVPFRFEGPDRYKAKGEVTEIKSLIDKIGILSGLNFKR